MTASLIIAAVTLLTIAYATAGPGPKSATGYANRGSEKLTRNDLNGAIADFTRAIELEPGFTFWRLSRGDAKSAKGDFDGAIADYSRIIEIDPQDAPAYEHRSYARKAKGDVDGAIADKALSNEKYADFYHARGNSVKKLNRFDDAIADFTRAIEFDPRFADAYLDRGSVKSLKGDADGAMLDYTRAIEIDPKFAFAFYGRGSIRNEKNDFDGAIADLTRAIEINPQYTYAFGNRGYAKERKGDLEGAIADYSRVIEIEPNNTTGYRMRGTAHFLRRHWTEAIEDFRRLCELDAQYRNRTQRLIWIAHSRMGEADVANVELDVYLKKRQGPSDDWPVTVAGFLLGRISEADLLTAAASSDTKKDSGQRCEAWYYIGVKHSLNSDTAAAAENFQKCIATGKKNYIEYQFAAAELKAMGQK